MPSRRGEGREPGRLETSRKHLFGSMGVLGEASNSVIAGCLLARGPDYKPVIDVAPDWESYDFEPINVDNEADKAYFEAALAWDLEIDGKKWADGKNIQAAAAIGGVQIETVPDFKLYVDNKKPEYLAKFPLGKIPGFEAQSGINLSETFAIARYIAKFAKNYPLMGSTPEEAAQVDQWISFGEAEVFTNVRIINNLLNGNLPYNKAIDNFYRERNTRALKYLESHLATRTFLITERITLADISIASILKSGFSWLIGASERATIPNTVRFYETVANQPVIKAIWGELIYVDKSPQY
ncbi:hypothetical protein FRC00_006542, partial [Tulasnella sp. 408]